MPHNPWHELETEQAGQEQRKQELEELLGIREREAEERESRFREETIDVRERREEALGTELERRLEEYGYKADVARTRTGEQQAGRGMLRSTVTGRRLSDIALQETATKAKGSFELKQEVERGKEEERRLFTKREDIQEAAKTSRMYAELDQSITTIQNLNSTIQEMKLRQELNQKQISAGQTNAIIGAAGMVVGAATIAYGFAGGLVAAGVVAVASVVSNNCCFMFLEARYGNGVLDKVVRRYRDEMMTDKNRRGYYKLSEVLVPLMRKHKLVKLGVRTFMTDPLVSYGKYYYGEGRIGVIFKPIHDFWMATFNFLGSDHAFIRENGEVV